MKNKSNNGHTELNRDVDIRKEVNRLGCNVVFIPHKLIQDHIACYYVEYDSKRIRPKVAKKLRIPLNKIWISDKFENQEEQILFHELQEIIYRRKGYRAAKAHQKAEHAETTIWKQRLT